ncbi:MAG: YfhO family protein [Lachnospiraceae bacterium]|nr:YfhO family protein [Lachnospiraceae bacterium]
MENKDAETNKGSQQENEDKKGSRVLDRSAWSNNAGEWSVLRFVGIYTLLFLICFFCVYGLSLVKGSSLVTDGGDGGMQYLPALHYYSEWLRTIVGNVFHGRFEIPMWDVSIAEGQDIIRTLHYYCIGEPLTLLSVFVPPDKITWFFGGLQILRLFLSGLAFAWFGTKLGYRKDRILLAASLAYAFSFYAVFYTIAYPNFILPLIFFPLILGGAEKVMKKESPVPYILAVSGAALSNFYYLYVVALLTIIYCAVRCIMMFRNVQKILKNLLTLLIYAIIAALVSSVILLPVFFAFTGDSRLHTDYAFHLIYDPDYYLTLPSLILDGFYTDQYVSAVGIGLLPACALLTLFSRKWKNKIDCAWIFMIMVLLFLLFPFFGQFFNGMSYTANRWSFAVCLLAAFLFLKTESGSAVKNDYSHLGIPVFLTAIVFCMGRTYTDYFTRIIPDDHWNMWRDVGSTWIALMILYGLYYAVVYKLHIFEGVKKVVRIKEPAIFDLYYMIFSLIYLTFMLGVRDNYHLIFGSACVTALWFGKRVIIDKKKYLQAALILGGVIASSAFYGYELNFLYSIGDETVSLKALKEEIKPTTETALWLTEKEEEPLTRYSCSDFEATVNDIGFGVSQTEYFWSLSDPGLTDLRYHAGLRSIEAASFYGYDRRPVLMGTDSVLYYLSKEEIRPPYGFEKTGAYESENGETIYLSRNTNYLPVGYTSDQWVSEERVSEVTPAGLDELMKHALILGQHNANAILPKELNDEQCQNILSGSVSVPYQVSLGDGMELINDGTLHVTEPGAVLTLETETVPNSEIYVQLLGIRYYDDRKTKDSVWTWRENTKARLFLGTEHSQISYEIETDEYRYYNGMNRFSGYLELEKEACNEVALMFTKKGYYSFDDIRITCDPVSDYRE